MTTEAQVTANRLNALKSTGPRTPQGKAVVAQNAIKHGFLARQNVIAGEDPQEFEVWRRGWLGELDPAGHAETMLAERVAGLAWRLRRAECIQNHVFDFLLAEDIEETMGCLPGELSAEDQQRLRSSPTTDPDLVVGRMVRNNYTHERAIERMMMYERWLENSLYRTMRELRQIKRSREAKGSDGESGDRRSVGAGPCACPASQGNHGGVPLPLDDAVSGAGREETPDSAKQSQPPAFEGTPCGVTTNGGDIPGDGQQGEGSRRQESGFCETKPVNAVCSAPVRACPEMQNDAAAPAVADSAKQSQSPVPQATPYGVTTSGVGCAKQSQSSEDGQQEEGSGQRGGSCETKAILGVNAECGVRNAKWQEEAMGPACQARPISPAGQVVDTAPPTNAEQSQTPQPTAALRAIPRPRPRVAWHTHGAERS